MGLFGVNMPPLYWEGEKAFRRLELEILQTSADGSIFAWVESGEHVGGLLASSPAHFAHCGNVISTPTDRMRTPNSKIHSMTNRGLQIEVPILPGDILERLGTSATPEITDLTAPINCSIQGEQLAIGLTGYGNNTQYFQTSGQTLAIMVQQFRRTYNQVNISRLQESKVLYVPQIGYLSNSKVPSLVRIDVQSLFQHGFYLDQRYFLKGQGSRWEKQNLEGSNLSISGSESFTFSPSGEIVLVFQKGAKSFG